MRLITLCFISLLYACAGDSGAAEQVEEEIIPIETPEKPPAEEGPMFAISYLMGPGGNLGIQDFTFVDGELYTLHQLDDETTITRFDGDDIDGYSLPGSVAGHQGLTHDGKYFWTSSGADLRTAVKFAYSDGDALQPIAHYRLFPSDYFNTSATPAIGGQYLIAQGAGPGGQRVVRVWYLDAFGDSGDYSERYLYEWPIDLSPVQGIASDGKRVWIIAGFGEIEAKPLNMYSINGELLGHQLIDIGMDGSDRYEPEGLAMLDGGLVFAMVTGTKDNRGTVLYSMDE